MAHMNVEHRDVKRNRAAPLLQTLFRVLFPARFPDPQNTEAENPAPVGKKVVLGISEYSCILRFHVSQWPKSPSSDPGRIGSS